MRRVIGTAAVLTLALGLVACEAETPAVPPAGAATAPRPAATHADGMHMPSGPVDPDPSRNFAKQMIEHHQGAVVMSEAALRGTLDPKMKALAEKIIADQKREIAEMNAFLRRTEPQG